MLSYTIKRWELKSESKHLFQYVNKHLTIPGLSVLEQVTCLARKHSAARALSYTLYLNSKNSYILTSHTSTIHPRSQKPPKCWKWKLNFRRLDLVKLKQKPSLHVCDSLHNYFTMKSTSNYAVLLNFETKKRWNTQIYEYYSSHSTQKWVVNSLNGCLYLFGRVCYLKRFYWRESSDYDRNMSVACA